MTAPDVAPLHATLIFGKKHTLLRSSGPTLISNRHVREWLIDQSTEITVGQFRLVVHPLLGGAATVVQAERLIEHASRLCKESTSDAISPEIRVPVAPENAVQSLASVGLTGSQVEAASQPANESRLESIEQLLQALQVSLKELHSSLGTDAKISSDAIVESVSQEIDEFGKRLFTDLNDQLSRESGTQQSLISDLANQFSNRLGSIDEQLSRFSDATVKQTSTLNDMLAQATSDQQLIESRFQEVISHRNELIEAVHNLHSEIALAYETQSSPYGTAEQGYHEDYSQAHPVFVDHGGGSEHQHNATALPSRDEQDYAHAHTDEAAPVLEETNPQNAVDAVTDDQLAYSLEQAQIQIQELNAQLRNLETERDIARHRVNSLAESWSHERAMKEESPVAEAGLGVLEGERRVPNANPHFSNEDSSFDYEKSHEVRAMSESVASDRDDIENRQLPAWFTRDEPANVSQTMDSQSPSIQIPGLRDYSDALYGNSIDYPSEGLERSDQEESFPVANEANMDSLSERLQRMLSDADDRRGPSKAVSELRTSASWSQKFNSQPSARSAVSSQTQEPPRNSIESNNEDNAIESLTGGHPLTGALRDLYRQPIETLESESSSEEDSYLETSAVAEDRLSSFVRSDESRFVEPVQPDPSDSLARMGQDERHSSAEMNSELAAPETGSPESTSEAEDESIEEYMQRLLNRVRGGSNDIKANTPPAKPVATQYSGQTANKVRSRVAASMGLDMDDPETVPKVEKLSDEMFVPRQQAPEQRNDLHALRELANTNARRAINRSDIRRMNAAFIVKMAITGLAVTSAVALFLFNGFQPNAIFLGMVSAAIVAGLWGYDCFSHLNRIRNENGNRASAAETAAGQSIRMSSSEGNGWRPTEA